MTVTDIYTNNEQQGGKRFSSGCRLTPIRVAVWCRVVCPMALQGCCSVGNGRHWQFNSKLWLFDDCKPETRRRVQIVLVSVLIILILVGFFLYGDNGMEKDNRKYRICFIDYMWYVAEIWHERERTNLNGRMLLFWCWLFVLLIPLGFPPILRLSAG